MGNKVYKGIFGIYTFQLLKINLKLICNTKKLIRTNVFLSFLGEKMMDVGILKGILGSISQKTPIYAPYYLPLINNTWGECAFGVPS